jgi:alpha-tubulin suppressor-like RCC1 family protein
MSSGTNNGTAWVWGDNDSGQCGIPVTTAFVNTPVQVPGITGAVAIACGWHHTVALTGSGTIVAWGLNGSGQLGNGSTTSSVTPVPVSGTSGAQLSGVKAIAAGYLHTLALLNNGTVYAWGYNGCGELGTNNMFTSSDVAVQVPGLSNILAIATTNESSFALRSDGTIWAWGLDQFDILADAVGINEPRPVLVGTMRDVMAIAVGSDHGVALRGDGRILAWGQTAKDALTSAATGYQSLPVVVPSFSLLQGTGSINTMVAAGDFHSLTVMSTGGVQTLWGWGDNTYGELGDGTMNSRYAPAMVQFSGYVNSGNDGMPNWLALTLGLNPFVPLTGNNGIPVGIQVEDGLGLNPPPPYSPYQLPPVGPNDPPPVITITIPVGATLQ